MFGHPLALYAVNTPRAGIVYMCIRKTNYQNEKRSVVIVESMKFLRLWQNERGGVEPKLAHGNERIWRNDYKFHHAEAGFSRGVSDPVPLAEVECEMYTVHKTIWGRKMWFFRTYLGTEEKQTVSIRFGNGITRTIWLLANGAKAFPVECPTDSAALLQESAGAPGYQLKTVLDIYDQSSAGSCLL